VEHLRAYLRTWRPNSLGLLFATHNGTPWDHSLVRKRSVWFPCVPAWQCPLLDQIGALMAVRLNRLGHTEAQTTMGYTHAVTADERRIADELGRILHVNARNEELRSVAVKPLTFSIQ